MNKGSSTPLSLVSHSVVSEAAAAAALGNFLEIQNPSLYPRPTQSEFTAAQLALVFCLHVTVAVLRLLLLLLLSRFSHVRLCMTP